MTLDNFFENKNLINLPDLDKFGIEHEVITEITARDLKTDALITAYEEEGELWFAFIYSDKIVCRNYFLDTKINDLVTRYGIDVILKFCGFEEYDYNQYRYANPKESLFEIDAKFSYDVKLRCDKLTFDKVVFRNTDCPNITDIIYFDNILKNKTKVKTDNLTYNNFLIILEYLIEEKIFPFVERTVEIEEEIDEQDCVYFNDKCLTKEEYLELLWTKLVEFDSYLAYESLFDITNRKLNLDEKIVEIENKIVDVFLREYEEQSIHDFLKEKIIEKVLID